MITISATLLGKLAVDNACERCFWRKFYLKKLPFDHIPGSYSTYDKAEKLAVEAWISSGMTPPWMSQFGEIAKLIPPPHWSRFHFEHGNMKVRGVADFICVLVSGGLLIPDMKTAKFSDAQEKWIPTYATQLGCYALAAEAQGIGTVEKLALIYMQPQAEGLDSDKMRDDGIAIMHKALMFGVDRNDERIHALCNRAYEILSKPLPDASETCQDCQRLEALLQLKEIPTP